MQSYGRPPKVLPRSPGTVQGVDRRLSRGAPAGSDFVAHGGLLTETPLLGNIALRTGEKLQWDGPNMKFINHPAANRYLQRAYRDGWAL